MAAVVLGAVVWTGKMLLEGTFMQLYIEGTSEDYQRAIDGSHEVLAAYGIFLVVAIASLMLFPKWWWVAALVGAPAILGGGLTLLFSFPALYASSVMFFPSLVSLLGEPLAICGAFGALIASVLRLRDPLMPETTDRPQVATPFVPSAGPTVSFHPAAPVMPVVPSFRYVGVWGPDGRVADDHPLLTTEMAGQVARYLDAAPVALRLESVADAGPASDDNHVARSVRTDGRWVWDDNLAHYVRTFRWAPVPEEFVRDIRARNFQLPLISEDQILWAGQYLEQVRPREWTPAQSG